MEPKQEMKIDTLRTAEEIAKRAIVLHCVIATAYGVSKQDISEWLEQESLLSELTPRERHFMRNSSISEQDRIRIMWFAESQVVLLWAIHKREILDDLRNTCNTSSLVAALPGLFESTQEFINMAILRHLDEIEREYEKLYDIHCEIRKAIRHNMPIPYGYHQHVVWYRHYGFNWLIGYCGQEWDEITPDT